MPGYLEAAMPAESIKYVPMEFEEYLGLPADVRAEWVDGVALVMTPAGWRHQIVEVNLVVALKSQLTGVAVVTEGGVRTGRTRFRIAMWP